MRVLLVDDDCQIHILFGKYFDRFGKEHGLTINTKCLSDPVQGLRELRETDKHYDVVVLDLRMPELGGDEIYSILMSEKPHVLDSVLFVTGYRGDLETQFSDQKLRILDKPFRYEQFAEALVNITGVK